MSTFKAITKLAKPVYKGFTATEDKPSVYDVNLRRMQDTTEYVHQITSNVNVLDEFHKAMDLINPEMIKIETLYGHDIKKMRYIAMAILVDKLRNICDPDTFYTIVKLVFTAYEI